MKALVKMSVLALAMVVMAGCQSNGGSGSGPSDEEVINAMVVDMMAALKAQDIEKMMAPYSEDFESDNGDLDATREFFNGAKEGGLLDDIEIDTSSMELTFETSDKANVGPIDLEASFGTLTLEFDLEKRDGTWVVVYMAQY